MNKNKGMIGIGLIVAIILGIIVVGGGAYYFGKNNSKKIVDESSPRLPINESQNNQPVNNNQNLPIVDIQPVKADLECTSNSPSSIKVLSPNGGEAYIAGQKITVKWSSCNVSPTLYDIVVALHQNGDWKNVVYLDNATINDGNEIFTIPSDVLPGSYKIRVGSSVAKIQQDFSDGLFTINSTAVPTTTDSKTYSNNDYGFSFNYPSSWKISEDKVNKEVTISTNEILPGADGSTYPSASITFKASNKTFFDNLRPTKIGVITYNENKSTIFADGDRCLKSNRLLGSLNSSVESITYGGSTMSTPAYGDSAILTTNGAIIIVHNAEDVFTPELRNQYSLIANSFKLLNGNQVFVPDCAK